MNNCARRFSVLLLIATSLVPSTSLATGSDVAVVSFEYKNEVFTREFIEWVAEFGARTPVVVGGEQSIEALVADACGTATPDNVTLFELALGADISLTANRELEIPPCLPIPVQERAPRLALPNESFWTYYQQLGSSTDAAAFVDRPIATFSSNNLPDLNATIDTAIVHDLAAANPSFDPQRSVQTVIEDAWSEVPARDVAYGADPGRIAYDAALISKALETSGINAPVAEVVAIGKTENIIADSVNADFVALAAETAATRWGAEGFVDAASIAEIVAASDISGDGDFLSEVVWIEPDASLGVEKRPTSLQVGDIIVAPTPVAVQYTQIPIDKQRVSAALETGTLSDPEIAPTPLETAGASAPQLNDLATFHVGEVTTQECSATQLNWQGSDLDRRFGTAALRTRIAATRRGLNVIEATVLVADSGFISAGRGSPLADHFLSIGGEALAEQSPSSNLLEHDRNHGTAVAGLAIGGPDHWPLSLSLGINLTITPAKIFTPIALKDGETIPVLDENLLRQVFSVDADVYNVSFGSTDYTLMDNFREDFVGIDNNKLLVIAAGNNNLNEADEGVDIGDAKIYPQFWGGHRDGRNILLVAALDGEALAKFSNHSETRISVAAPGCDVWSWKPVGNGMRHEQTRVSGTSFSTPIVSYVSAMVKALSPSERSSPPWVRARIIASADLTNIENVEHGRVLNPIKAIALYEDIVEVDEDAAGTNGLVSTRIISGRIQSPAPTQLVDVCEEFSLPEYAEPLKLARLPGTGGSEYVVYFMENRGLTLNTTKSCSPKQDALVVMKKEDGTNEYIELEKVRDIVFRYD